MAEYPIAYFYDKDGKEFAQIPNAESSTLPTPPEEVGYKFVRYAPAVGYRINGIDGAVSIKIGDIEYQTGSKNITRSITDVVGEYTEKRNAEKQVGGKKSVVELYYIEPYQFSELEYIYLKYNDGDRQYTSENKLIREIESGETFSIDLNADNAEVGKEDQKGTPVVAEVKMSIRDNSQDVYYYAMYVVQSGNVNIDFWHYTSGGFSVKDKENTIPIGAKYTSDMTPELPKLSTKGTWGCTWNPTPPHNGDTVTASKAIEGVFKSITQIEIRYGYDNKTSLETLTWYHTYPDIEIPTRKGYVCNGFYLYSTKNGKIVQTNDRNGKGRIKCTQSEIIDAIGDFYLLAEWDINTTEVKTLSELRGMITPIKSPFASDYSATVPILDVKDSNSAPTKGLSFQYGFNSDFSKTLDKSDGRVITRRMLNSLGNIGTQCQFYEQCGGIYTYDEDIAKAIGGYPKDGVLQYYDENTHLLRTVMSCKDDNTDDFVTDKTLIDGESWKYVDNNPTLRMKVDYSTYKDMSEDIFVSTGLADEIEVPYNSYLQLFSVGYIECMSLSREEIEDIIIPLNTGDDGEEIEEAYTNGMYWVNCSGKSFLDVKSIDSDSISSTMIGKWTPFSFGQAIPKLEIFHFECMSPLSPFSIGIPLNKGDKIRVRNVIVSPEMKQYSSSISGYPKGYVHATIFDDKRLKRTYPVKFAHLYKRTAATA